MTAGFVGADLANIINEAALLGVRRDRERVGMSELQEAVERIVAGLEKKNRVLSPAEKKRVAHHELGHALVALSIPNGEGVHKISIIPRGISALGYTMQAPTEDKHGRASDPIPHSAPPGPKNRGGHLERRTSQESCQSTATSGLGLPAACSATAARTVTANRLELRRRDDGLSPCPARSGP